MMDGRHSGAAAAFGGGQFDPAAAAEEQLLLRRKRKIDEWVASENRRDPEPWDYLRRREMQEILPDLYLGPYAVAVKRNLPFLKERGFTHIVCVRQEEEKKVIRPNAPEIFRYLEVNITDSDFGAILRHVRIVNDFVGTALALGGKVLVHGNIGAIRSAALVIAYVMEEMGWNAKLAFRFVHSRRAMVQVSQRTMGELEGLEPMLLARHQFKWSPMMSSVPNRVKRSLEEEGEATGAEQWAAATAGETRRALKRKISQLDEMDQF